MTTLNQIQDFLDEKTLAISGVSRNPKKFGYLVYKDLKDRGYTVYPVNPNTDTIDNEKCYRDVQDLPEHVTRMIIVTPPAQTDEIMLQAIKKGIKNIWIQQMSETPRSIALAKENNIHLITNECIYMFAEPVKGFHRFHRGIMKLFGKYPRLSKQAAPN